MTQRLAYLALVSLAILALLACTQNPPDNIVPAPTGTATSAPAVAATATATAPMPPTGTPAPQPSMPVIISPTPQPTPTSVPPAPRDTVATPRSGRLRLMDNLDDPQGYCVDVTGFGANVRLDVPLQAHTCKPGSDDQMFTQIAPADGGGIRLVEYDRCLAAETAESGAEVNVFGCDAGTVNQRFSLKEDGRVQLASPAGPVLCLGIAAGKGKPAGGRNHLRRDLVLYYCDEADPVLITWELLEQQ